jgi:hypothetical protein
MAVPRAVSDCDIPGPRRLFREGLLKLALLLALSICSLNSSPALPNIQDIDEPYGASEQRLEPEPYHVYFIDSNCRLRPLDRVPFPEGRFEIKSWPRMGYAVLSPRNIIGKDKSFQKSLIQVTEPKKMPFDDQMCFLKMNQGWTHLTRAEATRLWGMPNKRDDYYSFPARNFHHGEENIFHIDLSFDDQGLVEAYRIRGIALERPAWIKQKHEIIPGYFLGCSNNLDISIPFRPQAERISPKSVPGQKAIAFHIENGKGWIETVPGTTSKNVSPKNSNLAFDSAQLSLNYCASPYLGVTLKTLSRLWGMPRKSKESFCTFDIPCNDNGEKNIFHLDVQWDKDSSITETRLRGPGIGTGVWQSALAKSLEKAGIR